MEEIFKSIIPIIILNNNIPEQIASGVLIKIVDELFILTAAHVHDDIKNKNILIPTEDGLIPFLGYVSYLPIPDNQREKDTIDIAYYKFAKNWTHVFEKSISPISYAEIDFTDIQIEDDVYTFAGYPHRKSKFYKEVIKSELFSYTGLLSKEESYKTNSYTKKFNILINFNREKSVSLDGKPKISPLPEGISGGGVFSYPKQKSKIFLENKAIRLVGISHTYHPKTNLLAGTSINLYMMCILSNNPHLLTKINSKKDLIPLFIGFAYYKKEEWNEIRDAMEDKTSMPNFYDDWRNSLENYLDKLTIEGKQFFRIILELREMKEYARKNNLPLNSKLRIQMTNEKLAKMIFENVIIE